MDKIKESKYLAIDLGASSGRVIVGTIEENKLKLEEIYRFPNSGIQIGGSLYWDLLTLFKEMKNALLNYVKRYGPALESIGIDTWGVDFVLLDEKNELIEAILNLIVPVLNLEFFKYIK